MKATFTTDNKEHMSIIANIEDVHSLIFDLNAGNIERSYLKHSDVSEEYENGFREALIRVRHYLTALSHIE